MEKISLGEDLNPLGNELKSLKNKFKNTNLIRTKRISYFISHGNELLEFKKKKPGDINILAIIAIIELKTYLNLDSLVCGIVKCETIMVDLDENLVTYQEMPNFIFA